MAKMKKSTDTECWRGCGEMGSLIHCWWDCKLVQPLWRSVWRLLRELDVDLPYEPAVPLLGIWSGDRVSYDRDAYLFMLPASLLTVPRKRKPRRRLSTEEIMKSPQHHRILFLNRKEKWNFQVINETGKCYAEVTWARIHLWHDKEKPRDRYWA